MAKKYRIKPGIIGNAVMDAYYKIEHDVINTYRKIEKAFVDRFLEEVDEDEPAGRRPYGKKATYKHHERQEKETMKKSNFVALILGTVGVVFFALGMCMTTLTEWNMFQQGIICGVIGLAVLLADLVIWRRMEGKEPIHLSGKTLATIALAVVGALLLGVGRCLCMVFGYLVQGILIGLVGIVGLLCLIPLTKGLK